MQYVIKTSNSGIKAIKKHDQYNCKELAKQQSGNPDTVLPICKYIKTSLIRTPVIRTSQGRSPREGIVFLVNK